MLALYLLLPLLASVTLAAPAQNRVDLEQRQRRPPGGGRPSRVRPGATQVAATTAAAGPVAPAPSAPASSAAPASDAPAGTAVESPAPVVPATSAAAGVSDGAATADPVAPSLPADTAAADAPADPTSAGGTDAAAASSAPAASASGATSTGSSGAAAGSGPVGIGWDPAKNTASMQTYIDAGLQWYTNWSPKAADYAVEFVPMVWGSGSVPEVKAAMGSWPSGTKYVLSFNEPDMEHDGGSAMTVADGVKFHNEFAATLGDGYEIGAPAVANHDVGEKWLDVSTFKDLLDWAGGSSSRTGWQAVRPPEGANTISSLFIFTAGTKVIDYAKKFSTKYKKPLWITEWACHDFGTKEKCSPAEAEQFMKTIVEWFRGEGSSMVTRWAWFGAFPDMKNWNGNDMDSNRIANADGTINALGKEYMKL